ncbi:hypothetical protein ZIOFF_040152 [Zingiber officinale]|uniref:Piwi domain-containing protein n=1 Tax=Zingiber officinale TaxID=94328 RepID=A0A8J5G883_ZINOF|nr:hypothetical protein ZIOFF_040152 [Zingiber officinale]
MVMVSARLLQTLPCCGIGVEWKDRRRLRGFRCSTISVEVLVVGISDIRWGSSKLQGTRSEMEDEVVLRSDGLSGFSFAAILDDHVGGRDTVLVDALSRRIPLVRDRPTIIFGADVTHPHPGEDSSPSIAVVVASQD